MLNQRTDCLTYTINLLILLKIHFYIDSTKGNSADWRQIHRYCSITSPVYDCLTAGHGPPLIRGVFSPYGLTLSSILIRADWLINLPIGIHHRLHIAIIIGLPYFHHVI